MAPVPTTKKALAEISKDPEGYLEAFSPDEIAEFLKKASDAYYNSGAPIISDDVFDTAADYLKARAPEHVFFTEVGALPHAGEVKIPYWMGSQNKIRDDPAAIVRFVKKYPGGDYVISDKLDGISALIADGRMYTRGNGHVGQDITYFMGKVSGAINTTAAAAVRGEIIISKANWTEINNLGANARNVVAGTLNAKKPNPTIVKCLEFVAYEYIAGAPIKAADGLKKLAELGYKVVDYKIVDKLSDKDLKARLVARKAASEYEIDGLVVTDNAKAHKRVEDKNPAYAFAYKTMATHDQAVAVVDHVEWNASKDGLLKPIVWFKEAVNLDGVEIRKATGHNAKYIKDNAIGPEARVTIIRSGGVIPKIEEVARPAPNGPAFPTDVPYKWNESEVEIMLAEIENNQAVKIKELAHFITKMGINGIGQGLLEKVGVTTIPDLLRIKKEDLLKKPGFKETSAANFVAALEEIKKASVLDWMVASNIFGAGLGSKKIKPIIDAYAFPRIPTKTDLMDLPGVGEVTAKSYLAGLPLFAEFIKGIPAGFYTPGAAAGPSGPSNTTSPLKDKTFVFTGFRDKELERKIEAAGGKITGSVSSKTSYVIAADPNGNSASIVKAQKLDIPVLSRYDELFA